MVLQEKQGIVWNRNCLNVIRLIAAVSVMYGHICIHLNIAAPAFLTRIMSFFFGVPIFFSMSGFLIWHSIERSKSFLEYAGNRFWRIYPELWCGVILELALLILLADQPIVWRDLCAFAVTQGTVLQFWTPDSLRFYGCGTPNGSLWTICVIIQFYIVIYFVYHYLRNKKLVHWVLILTAAILVGVGSPFLADVLPEIWYKLYNQTLIPYFWLFLVGAMAAQYREYLVPFVQKYWYVLLSTSLFSMITGLDVNTGANGYSVMRCMTLFGGLLGFAYRFPTWNLRRDISYGIYIYHMTVVNAMIMLGISGKLEHLMIAGVISCSLAWFSSLHFGRISSRKRKH